MKPRTTIGLALFGITAFGAPLSSVAESFPLEAATDLVVELPPRERPRRVVRELLGRTRLQALNLTRYEMEFYGYGSTPELEANPTALDEAEEVLLSSFLRISRERLERYWRLKDRWDTLRGKRRIDGGAALESATEGLRLRISPRSYLVDGGALVGAKFRLGGLRSELLSRAGLGVTHELNGDNLRLLFAVDKDAWGAFVVYHTDRRDRGESVELGVSFSF